ncbi:MAG TPA: FkbM family methyltransferase [Coleofasciculaceae cyanobacterium]|jgi:FkbM family methyltransferase
MKQIIQKTANSLGYRISKIRQPINYPVIDVLDLVLQDYLKQEQDIFFIQIGANDGTTADPINKLIKKYRLRGLLVEPQPKMFKKLIENYQSEGQLIFENSAVFDQDGTVRFYAIREEEPKLPMWCYQIANLDRNRILDLLSDQKKNLNLPTNIETLVEEITVPAVTFKTLLSKHKVEKLDLLIIDTLGYDFEILKMIPFDLVKPPIINFEHTLLSIDDQEACFMYLAELGYSLVQVGVDTVAYLQNQGKPRSH